MAPPRETKIQQRRAREPSGRWPGVCPPLAGGRSDCFKQGRVGSAPPWGPAGRGAVPWFGRRSGGGPRREGATVQGRAEEEDDSPAWGDMPVPPLHLLTADQDKRQRYTVDPQIGRAS